MSGLVDQRARDREAALHAAGERLDLVRRPVGQLGELEQLDRATLDLGPRQAEVAAVDPEVLLDGELLVEGVLLRDDAEPGADLRAVAARVEAEDASARPR